MSEESMSSESIESSSGDESQSGNLSSNGFDGSSTEGATEQLQDQIQDAVDAGATKEEIKEMIEEFELKVNGKTIKHKLDWNDKEAIKRELQKSYAFNDVSQEYSNVKKHLNSKIEMWKKDPIQLFKDMGIDREKFLEAEVKKELDELELTPEQKKARDYEAKIAAYEAKEAQQKAEQEARERHQQDEEALSVLRSEIQGALEGHQFLKPNEDTERRIADVMASLSVKNPNVTAEDALPYVEAEIKREFNALIENMPEEFLERMLSKTAIEKIGKKAPRPQPPVKTKQVPTASSQIAKPTAQSVVAKQEAALSKPKTFEEMMNQR